MVEQEETKSKGRTDQGNLGHDIQVRCCSSCSNGNDNSNSVNNPKQSAKSQLKLDLIKLGLSLLSP